MYNRDRGGRSGDRRGGGRFNDRGPKQMHQAVCADCGNACEVPFKPTGSRPIYCSNCLDKHRPRDDRRDGGSFRDRGDRPMFQAKCDNCGKSCEVPFRPTGEKPVYCQDCFGDKASRQGGGKSAGSSSGGDLMAEIKSLNAKLDKILNVLAPTTVHEIPLKKAPVSSSKKSVKPAPVSKKPAKKVAQKSAKKKATTASARSASAKKKK